MKLIKIILIINFTFYCDTILGQKQPEDIVISFYEKFKIDNDAAINDFMKPISDDEEKLEEIKREYKKAKGYYGKLGKIELVRKKNIGENVVELTYLFRHERYPLVFKFQFYRFDKDWIQINFKFNDEIKKEFFNED